MLRCLVVGLLSVGLCFGAADAATQRLETGLSEQPVSTKESQELLRLMLMLGQHEEAIAALEEMTKLQAHDPEAWFMLGIARRMQGNLLSAEDAFRQVILLDPVQVRPRIELGVTLILRGDFDGAYAILDEARLLTNNTHVRRNIQNIMNRINRQRTLVLNFGVRLQPDSNTNYATGRQDVVIAGFPFALDQKARRSKGIGIGFDSFVRFSPEIQDEFRVVADLMATGVHFFGPCCDDYTVGTAAGIGWNSEGTSIITQVFARERFYDSYPYVYENGIRMEASLTRPLYSLHWAGELGDSRILPLNMDGDLLRGLVAAEALIANEIAVGLILRGERLNYPSATQSFTAYTIEGRVMLPGPWRYPVRISGAIVQREYDGPTITTSGSERQDIFYSTTATLEFDTVSFYGMTPAIGITYQVQKSNDILGKYQRAAAVFELTRRF